MRSLRNVIKGSSWYGLVDCPFPGHFESGKPLATLATEPALVLQEVRNRGNATNLLMRHGLARSYYVILTRLVRTMVFGLEGKSQVRVSG